VYSRSGILRQDDDVEVLKVEAVELVDDGLLTAEIFEFGNLVAVVIDARERGDVGRGESERIVAVVGVVGLNYLQTGLADLERGYKRVDECGGGLVGALDALDGELADNARAVVQVVCVGGQVAIADTVVNTQTNGAVDERSCGK